MGVQFAGNTILQTDLIPMSTSAGTVLASLKQDASLLTVLEQSP